MYNFICRYRRSISLPLLTSLLEEGLRLAGNDHVAKTNIYESVVRTAYTRRATASFLNASEQWSKADVELHNNVLKTNVTFVYGFKRLAIILEKKGAIDEAIALVLQALDKKLLDETIGEYPDRLLRLRAQKLIDEAIAMCQRAIALKLDDMTKGNYAGRKERLLKRIENRKED